jgi:hypothetical protein
MHLRIAMTRCCAALLIALLTVSGAAARIGARLAF